MSRVPYEKTRFPYSGLYQSWWAAVLSGNESAQRRAGEAHSRMIEREHGPHDSWFYRTRKQAQP